MQIVQRLAEQCRVLLPRDVRGEIGGMRERRLVIQRRVGRDLLELSGQCLGREAVVDQGGRLRVRHAARIQVELEVERRDGFGWRLCGGLDHLGQ